MKFSNLFKSFNASKDIHPHRTHSFPVKSGFVSTSIKISWIGRCDKCWHLRVPPVWRLVELIPYDVISEYGGRINLRTSIVSLRSYFSTYVTCFFVHLAPILNSYCLFFSYGFYFFTSAISNKRFKYLVCNRQMQQCGSVLHILQSIVHRIALRIIAYCIMGKNLCLRCVDWALVSFMHDELTSSHVYVNTSR